MDQSVHRLLSSATLVNQAVGDALSDLLFCEAVLRLKGWDCKVTNRVSLAFLSALDLIYYCCICRDPKVRVTTWVLVRFTSDTLREVVHPEDSRDNPADWLKRREAHT